MTTILLIIIYLAFISLGLPDSLFGSAWPVMQADLGVPLSSAGIISMMVSGATIVSSLFSERLLRRFGTGKLTLISVFATACALLGYALAPSFWFFCLLAIPLGLGAGAVDAGLNNFVALHYQPRHMSWLHCFWGIGATLGPVIMSFFIAKNGAWRGGYFAVALIQFFLVSILFFSLPIWKKVEGAAQKKAEKEEAQNPPERSKTPLGIPGVKPALASFFFYAAVEAGTGLWASSFLVGQRGLSAEIAASWVSLFFFGITAGRFACGFLTMRFNNRQMIRLGQAISLSGILFFLLPLPPLFWLVGLVLLGLGSAPVFPCLIGATPDRFGRANSPSVIGYQMAFSYVGSTFMPPLLGLIAAKTTFAIFPYFILACLLLTMISTERVNRLVYHQRKNG